MTFFAKAAALAAMGFVLDFAIDGGSPIQIIIRFIICHFLHICAV
jgi:hypothetical protein